MSRPPDQQRNSRLQILGAVAALLTVLAVFAHLGAPEAPQSNERTGQPVIPNFAMIRAEAAQIRVTLADESYQLVNGPDGWKLGSQAGYPVRPDRLAALASGLEELKWGESRTRDPDKMNRIGLGDPRDGGTGALVEIVNEAGAVTASLITGRKGEHVYARRPDEQRAFRVSGDLPPLYNHDAWLDLDIIDIHSDAVSAVRLTDSRGASLYLQRTVGSSDRSFRPAPPYQDYRLVSRIAASTPALALARFKPIGVKPASELATRPAARHITETHDGLEVDLKAYRERDGFFVTLRAIEAGEGANRGSTINDKAKGWAFELTEFDWNEFTPNISSIVRPPVPDTPDEDAAPTQP
ncbi:DUF4340 domain-containing protein [Hyphomonas johnsonii]|uniref:DUF4340 domain-containing protein n=1 Tax=Hyphomonas johnsonii MHS-2 TaxID=1280950 RepID=A0A059FMG0_9PROT|nr:DUF4340 domain-containing protein [Hyphomonas johnsonii]KCZ91860.1 hypothetical protein HJO_12102 [Hyphomonas johnsonii MHS-2]